MKILADENIPKARELFAAHGQLKTFHGRDLEKAQLLDADILLVRSITQVNEALLAGTSVRFVGTATIGTDHVDMDWLAGQNIGFANAPGCNAIAVAEYILSGLFVISSQYDLDLRTANVGIVGAGNVGSALAHRLSILGIPHLLYDPPLARAGDPRPLVSMEELSNCDIISCHVPLTYEAQSEWPTYHMVDEAFLNSMTNMKYFINSSRGSVVDTAALLNWLRASEEHQAINDVWENEPNISTALLDASLVGTPHIAGHSYEGKVRGTIMLYQAFCKYFNLECTVDTTELLQDNLPKDVIQLQQNLNYMQAMSSAIWRVYNIRDDDKALRAGLNKDLGAHFDGLRKGYKIRRECSAHRLDDVSAPDGALKTLKQLGFRV